MGVRSLHHFGLTQHGLVTRQQVLSVKTQGSLKSLLLSGELMPVYTTVYALPGARLDAVTRVCAAVLASAEGTVASHQSAALLHRMNVVATDLAHVMVPGERSRFRSDLKAHYGNLAQADKTVVDEVPVTTVERTIVDLASMLPRGRLARVIDNAVIAQSTTYESCWEALQRAGRKGRTGAAFLRTFLEERANLGEHDIDGVTKLVILRAAKQAGLPAPITEHPVLTRRETYYLDVAWPDRRIGAEGDGYSVHGRSKKTFDEDRQRHNDICAQGWTLLHFTARMPVAEIARQLTEVWLVCPPGDAKPTTPR